MICRWYLVWIPLVIFQNCLKFYSPHGLWNYIYYFRNITRGIYAKHHIMLLLSLILIVCVEVFFCALCNMMSQHIRRISTLSNVQYMYSIHQHKRSPLKIKFAAAACDQSCCMDGTSSWYWVRLHMIYWHQSYFMNLLLVRCNNYSQG